MEVATLVDMGFEQAQAERAVAATQGQGVEAAVNWILNNPGAGSQGEGQTLGGQPATQPSTGQAGDGEQQQQQPAAKKPLTAEEKEEQARKLQEKIRERRAQREKEEAKREIEQQKRRMESSKTLVQAKREAEDAEMKRLAEQKRKEKLEKKRRQERIRAELAKDKAEREAARREAERQQARATNASSTPVAAPPQPQAPPASSATSCRIQVRLPGAQPLRTSFSPDDKLQLLFEKIAATGSVAPGYSLVQTIPRRTFTETQDADTTFKDAGLVPSASLHLKPAP